MGIDNRRNPLTKKASSPGIILTGVRKPPCTSGGFSIVFYLVVARYLPCHEIMCCLETNPHVTKITNETIRPDHVM